MTILAKKTHYTRRLSRERNGGLQQRAAAERDSRYLPLLYACARAANAADAAETASGDILQLVLEETGWECGRAYVRVGAEVETNGRWLVVGVGPAGGRPRPGLTREGPAGVAAATLEVGAARFEDGVVAVPIRRYGGEVLGVLQFNGAATPEAALAAALADIAEQLAWVVARGWAQRAALRRQGELDQTGRIASMRELARNLAHEVNQPLAAVVGYAGGALQLLEQGRADEDKMRRALEQVGAQAKRASGIIQEFREFLRHDEARHERIVLAELIEAAVALVADAAQARAVKIRLAVPEGLPKVVGDAVQLQQVLINLMQNGIEAMSAPEVRERRLEIGVELCEQVEIRISDTGTGMAPDLIPQLFAPFLTTKPHGLGMGLPMSRSIVEYHGGRLSGENNPDGGMTFRIRLPLA